MSIGFTQRGSFAERESRLTCSAHPSFLPLICGWRRELRLVEQGLPPVHAVTQPRTTSSLLFPQLQINGRHNKTFVLGKCLVTLEIQRLCSHDENGWTSRSSTSNPPTNFGDFRQKKFFVDFFPAALNLNSIKSNTFINQMYLNIYLLITRHLVATLKTECDR